MTDSVFLPPEPRPPASSQRLAKPAPISPGPASRPLPRNPLPTLGLLALALIPILVLVLAVVAVFRPSATPRRLPGKITAPLLARSVVVPVDLEAAAAVLASAELTGKADASVYRDINPDRLRLWRSLVLHLSDHCQESPAELVALITLGKDEQAKYNDEPVELIGTANGLSLLATAAYRPSAKGSCIGIMSVWLDRLKAEARQARPSDARQR